MGRSGKNEYGWPWYQPYVISFSLGVFLLYFCVLRERNDIDDLLENGTLFEQVPGMEVAHLTFLYNLNKSNGENVDAIKKRLEELGHPVE